jgi:hypothetical protein
VADWSTISSFATGGGTLVLAIATFSAVRSANRTARTAELARQAGLRPLLMHSRLQDPPEKIRWQDDHWARLDGGHAHVQVADGVIWLAMSIRNAGNGIAVLHAWQWREPTTLADSAPSPDSFRRLTRDEYVAAGDTGFWQGAIRDTADPGYAPIRTKVENSETFAIDLLYSDHEGQQRTISCFTVTPLKDDAWLCSVVRHWNLDRDDPR